MGDEKICPAHFGTKLYKYDCGGKILRREPLISSDEMLGKITGLKNFEGDAWELEKLAEIIPYYLYECENGHILTRPDGWADVPTVPPGTIKCRFGWGNKQHHWYYNLSDEEKDKVWK
ncbi:MAG: hypothetical protein SVM80_09975 [Halobacteriota archaeon]|nr:hypothetical protein [Halobacteriota archaeon]